jgi:hypothetical protein
MIRWFWTVVIALVSMGFQPGAYAATVGKGGGFQIARSSPTTGSAGVRAPGAAGGSDFERLLGNPPSPSWMGDSPWELKDLLKMPFKPGDMAEIKGLLTPKNLAKGLLGAGVAYLAGEALEKLVKEACVRGMSGTLVMNPDAAFQECVPQQSPEPSTGYDYFVDVRDMPGGVHYRTPDLACSAWLEYYKLHGSFGAYVNAFTSTSSTCILKGAGGNYASSQIYNVQAVCPSGQYQWADGTCHTTAQVQDVQWRDVTRAGAEQKLEDAIKVDANKPKVLDAVRDMIDKGGQVDIDSPTITGPSKSADSVETTTTTTQTASGPVTITNTTTTTTNYTYSNSNVTVNQTSTTVSRDAAGNVVGSTTSTGAPQADDGPPTDSALPPVPNLYDRKYPNGMEGVWNQYKDQIKGTPIGSLAQKLMPTVSDGGTCPSWPLNLNLSQWAAFGVHDVAPPCSIWGVAKAILILSALLLARALIFGG